MGQNPPGTGGPLGTQGSKTPPLESPGIRAEDQKAQFQRLDADRDGKLNTEEFARFGDLTRRIGSGTAGTTGTSTPAASNAAPRQAEDGRTLFPKLDADHDGLISLEEFQKMPVTTLPLSPVGPQGEGARLPRASGATAGVPSLAKADHSALFYKLDKDKDTFVNQEEFGKISGPELPFGDQAAVFHQLDANADGKLSKEEFLKMPPSK